MHRGGCLELYYCNMVEWSWWDSSLICKTNWFPSVLWHCWFHHHHHHHHRHPRILKQNFRAAMTCKNRPRYDL